MTFRFSAISKLFLLIKVIKTLSKVFMHQYNYPKLIWMKQNVYFAYSNYRSNWQLIDNFCLHLSEPNRIETRRKRIVNRIVTIEPRCTVFSVNRFTSTGNQDKHKSSDEFDFGPDQTTHFGVTCPWVTKILHFRTWISLRPVGHSWSNFICSITGCGERLHNVLRQIGS